MPQAIESERQVLAACMIEGRQAMKRIAHIVSHKDFFNKKHAVIFRALEYLYREQKDIDVVTVHDFLKLKGYSDMVGGPAFLSALSDDFTALAHVVGHARIVSDRAVLRKIIETCSNIARRAHSEDDLDKFLLDAESALKTATRASYVAENRHNVVDLETWREIARNTEPTPGTVRGLSSGYKAVDDITEGFEGGEMYILTGHTGQGKSQLATNWAINVAQRDKTVLFINTEMTKLQMGRRVNNILGENMVTGRIITNDRSDILHRDVIAIMENAKEKGCDLVVVDHLHYFARSIDNTTGEISRMTKDFKDAAVNLDIPLLMLCHVDQSKPATYRPTLKMLKNSSSIAQDADVVLTIFRDEEKNPGVLEIIRLKGRSTAGRIRTGVLYYDGLKLSEQKPATIQPNNYAEQAAKQLGESDEVDLSVSDWTGSQAVGPVVPIG